MLYVVVHSLPGRIRCRVAPDTLGRYDTGAVARAISDIKGVDHSVINPRTGSILMFYDENIVPKDMLLSRLNLLILEDIPLRNTENKEKSIIWSYIGYQLFRFLQPVPLRPFFTIIGAVPFFIRGLKALYRCKANIDLLDASAIGVALFQRNFKSASTLIMLLRTGDYLEKWAKQRSRDSLADTISLNVGQVWVRRGGVEEQIPYKQLKMGDEVVVRAGSMIPVDGKVVCGDALVNESSMTGEPLAVRRTIGDTVHASAVVEEGEIFVEMKNSGEGTRFQQIVRLIQESESKKAEVEIYANEMADKIVPLNFALAGGVFAVSRNITKMSTALSVDYSCAIKLSTPLVFLAAMKEGVHNGLLFKGGAMLETLSKVDTIVFDKTGTLTRATPKVKSVDAYNGYSATEVVKIAACLEEHFPHPVAKAVVKYAYEKKIEHREEHTEVKYIAAHGIASLYQGEHTVIGSKHFVSEDEGVDISVAVAEEDIAAQQGYSVLYLAKNHKLIGLIYIEDPVREESAEVISMLRQTGIKHVYMFTGDNYRNAEKIASQLGIESFRAEVLPHEKAELVNELRAQGKTVAMVGDGMNDSPALSAADIGISMRGGADLAQSVADITLNSSSLHSLVVARLMSLNAIKRIKINNMSAIGINSMLMLFGIVGLITPASSVWLHNLATLGISFNSMRALMPKAKKEEEK